MRIPLAILAAIRCLEARAADPLPRAKAEIDKGKRVVVLMSHTPGNYRATLRPLVGALVLQAIDR